MSGYSDETIIQWDPMAGADRDVDVRCQSTRIVTVKKPHECWIGVLEERPHVIDPGSRARVERALVDGEWGSWYSCIPCMTAWLKELGIKPDEPSTVKRP